MQTVLELIHALDELRTPALLVLVVLATLLWVELKRIREELSRKAELQALNNVGAKVARIDKEFGVEVSKVRLAVVAIGTKCEMPEVIKDFLR